MSTDFKAARFWRRGLLVADSIFLALGIGLALQYVIGLALGLILEEIDWQAVFVLPGIVVGMWFARRLHRSRVDYGMGPARTIAVLAGAVVAGGASVWLSWDPASSAILLALVALVAAAAGAVLVDAVIDLGSTRTHLALDLLRPAAISATIVALMSQSSDPDFGIIAAALVVLAVLVGIAALVWDAIASRVARSRAQGHGGTPVGAA